MLARTADAAPADTQRQPRGAMTASTNTDRQPDPLDTGYVLGLVDTALDAIAAAMTGAELKQIRIDHAGEKSPLALANRAIGQLEPGQRKHAGQLVGQARGRVNQALAARQVPIGIREPSSKDHCGSD